MNQADRLYAIKAALPSAAHSDSDFLLSAVEAGLSPEQAKAKWSAEASARAQAAAERQAAEELEAEARYQQMQAQRPRVGASPVAMVGHSYSGGSGGAERRWKSLVRAKMDEGMSASEAMDAIDAEDPGLRVQMIRDANRNPDWEEDPGFDD